MRIFHLVTISALFLASCAVSTRSLSLNENISVPDSAEAILQVSADDWAYGPENAPITLIEYSDFQCPACGAYAPVLAQLKKDFPDTLRVVVRHFPLTQIHQNAISAAVAVEAAGMQGKFWEMHDKLFANQQEWSKIMDPTNLFSSYAEDLGLQVEQFLNDMQSETAINNVSYDAATGTQLKLTGTPSFFLNGQKLPNPQNYEEFKQAIEALIN